MAIALAEAGADIIGVSASLEKTGSEIEQAVTKLGRKFTAYTCDFSHRPSLYDFIKSVKSDFPTIDILVNNAGTIKRAPAIEHGDDLWDYVIEVNQTAQFILIREIGKEMVAKGNGKSAPTAISNPPHFRMLAMCLLILLNIKLLTDGIINIAFPNK